MMPEMKGPMKSQNPEVANSNVVTSILCSLEPGRQGTQARVVRSLRHLPTSMWHSPVGLGLICHKRMSFKTFIQWLVDKKSSLCSWIWVGDKVALGAVSIYIIEWEVSLRSKTNYKGVEPRHLGGNGPAAPRHLGGNGPAAPYPWWAPKWNKPWNLLSF